MSRPESRFSVRPARPSDGNGLLLLARELAHGPLLSRYAADEARLGAELSALADSDHRTETLLIAEETASHAESAESVDAAGRLCALARFSHAGMFGRLGGYLQLIAVAPSHQGQGVGSLLLSHVEQTVRTLRTLTKRRIASMLGTAIARSVSFPPTYDPTSPNTSFGSDCAVRNHFGSI